MLPTPTGQGRNSSSSGSEDSEEAAEYRRRAPPRGVLQALRHGSEEDDEDSSDTSSSSGPSGELASSEVERLRSVRFVPPVLLSHSSTEIICPRACTCGRCSSPSSSLHSSMCNASLSPSHSPQVQCLSQTAHQGPE